jgi:hypothetical protein
MLEKLGQDFFSELVWLLYKKTFTGDAPRDDAIELGVL